MGAKAPEKLKLRRQSCKCDVCGRKFLNASTLTSHRKSVHKMGPVENKRMLIKKPPDLPNAKAVRNKIVSPGNSKIGAQMHSSKSLNKSKTEANQISNSKKSNVKKKIEFKCPKCIKVFSVYFSAYRHIQKAHCVDKNDQPVPPNSSDLIRPVRVELFECCKSILPLTEEHICKEPAVEKLDRYMCLGCQKTFDNLLLFEQHAKVLHIDKVECLFFPNNSEFTAWKSELETITQVKFKTLVPPAEKSKQIYHCSHQPPVQAEKTLLCPSSLNVTELINGYQVLYFKEHFGHSCLDLPQLKYKKYSILPFLNDVEIQNIDADEHVYDQFKSIMNNVTLGAAKADMGVLYSLLNKALQMTLVLNSMGQEEEELVDNKSMTDNQITKVLSEVKTYPGKQKAETAKKALKLTKPEIDDNENIKTDTIINKPLLNKTVSKKSIQSLPSTPVKKGFIQSSPSFNDTYKDFVDQNFKTAISDSGLPKKNPVRKKNVVKTKIGQFKVKSSLSPKGPEAPTPSPVKVLPDLLPKRPPSLSPKTTEPNVASKRTKPSLSPKRTYPILSPKRTKQIISPKRLKPTLSPKLTKETPVLSPKPPKTSKQKIQKLEFKVKPDIKYEVKEQENDCNILILKI